MELNAKVNALIRAKKVLAIMGPTASGKSQLSMALANVLPVEIISVDSALIYQHMDIGSAKPTPAEMKAVPHHLIDIIPPDQTYSASEFVEDVHRLVQEIFSRGRLPILVGGTMMYFNALQQGLNDLPSADLEVRSKLQAIWDENPELLHQKLQQVDHVSAARINPNDPQRLIRALEVYELTGKNLTEHRQNPKSGLTAFSLVKVALIPENRALLHAQIEKRFLQMLDDGFMEEVRSLFSRGDLDAEMTSIRCVGYRQAWSYLEQEYDYDTFIHKGVVATRQLAKRQLTWLRKETDITVIDPYQTSLEDRVKLTLSALAIEQ